MNTIQRMVDLIWWDFPRKIMIIVVSDLELLAADQSEMRIEILQIFHYRRCGDSLVFAQSYDKCSCPLVSVVQVCRNEAAQQLYIAVGFPKACFASFDLVRVLRQHCVRLHTHIQYLYAFN